jgi:hypothetical protein
VKGKEMHTHQMASLAAVVLALAACSGTESSDSASGKGCAVELFKDPNFQGQSVTLTGDTDPLDSAIKGQVSSAKVTKGEWRFFSEPGFKAPLGDYPAGEYAELLPDGQLASLRCLER